MSNGFPSIRTKRLCCSNLNHKESGLTKSYMMSLNYTKCLLIYFPGYFVLSYLMMCPLSFAARAGS